MRRRGSSNGSSSGRDGGRSRARRQQQEQQQQEQQQQQQQQQYQQPAATPGSFGEVDAENAAGLRALAQGSIPDAVKHLKKAVEIDTTAYYAHANLAVAYARAGQHADAVEDFNFAMGLAPDCALALYGGAESLIEAGHPERAFDYYSAAARAMRGYPPRELPTKENLAPCVACDVVAATLDTATPFKLTHDAAQVRYLIGRGILPNTFSKVADMHDDAAQRIKALPLAPYGVNVSQILGADFNRMYHVRIPSAVVGDAVNKQLQPTSRGAQHTVYDGVLTQEALEEVLAYCLESHVFHIGKNGYVVGNSEGGFGSDALLRIASELRTQLPDTLGKHTLRGMVVHKHASEWESSDVRAEEAAFVAVVWLTPDAANLDASSGGLVLHGGTPCHRNCDADFNNDAGRVEIFMKQASEMSTIPYKLNRMVVFPGGVAYRSQKCRFSSKFEDQRVRVSMLFGKRSSQ
jgi:tetratricopeptide (TPR) repeat protein